MCCAGRGTIRQSQDWRLLFSRDLDLRVTAWQGSVDGSDNTFYMPSQRRPLGIANHYKRNSAESQILLIANILVGRHENFETHFLGSF
jgi:hypothetical protein